jgi:hypothetical protein
VRHASISEEVVSGVKEGVYVGASAAELQVVGVGNDMKLAAAGCSCQEVLQTQQQQQQEQQQQQCGEGLSDQARPLYCT